MEVPKCDLAGGGARVSIDSLWADDNSAPAGEATSIHVCWTADHLFVHAEAVDSDIISSTTSCGSSTWDGDSIEIFMGPVISREELPTSDPWSVKLPDPAAWMEVDISQAGGMYFDVITNGKDGNSFGKSRPIANKGPGQCVVPGLSYHVWDIHPARCPSSAPCAGWGAEVTIPWSSFGIPEFKRVIDDWGRSSVPRQWRINFCAQPPLRFPCLPLSSPPPLRLLFLFGPHRRIILCSAVHES